MAPVFVGVAAVLYVARRATHRRHRVTVPDGGKLADEIIVVTRTEVPGEQEIGITSSPAEGDPLAQFEAELGEAPDVLPHEPVAMAPATESSVPNQSWFAEAGSSSSSGLPPAERPPSREMLEPENWRLPAAADSGNVPRKSVIVGLGGTSRRIGTRPLLTALGIIVGTALIVYVTAGAIRSHAKYAKSDPQRIQTSDKFAAPTTPSETSPFAPGAFPLAAQPLKPPRPAGGATASGSPSSDEKGAKDAKSDQRSANRRRSRHRRTPGDDMRAFFRKIFR
jgi:hypothetical protein